MLLGIFTFLILWHSRWCSGKESACQGRNCRRLGFDFWVGKTLWRRAWQPTPVILPREFHGQRSLAGYSPWCHRVRYDWACTHIKHLDTRSTDASLLNLFPTSPTSSPWKFIHTIKKSHSIYRLVSICCMDYAFLENSGNFLIILLNFSLLG